MKRIRWVMSFIFLAALASIVIVFNTTKPRVLILHSYDKDYVWTRDVDVGINRALKEQHEYTTRWFYMDTKRHPWKEFKVNAGKTVQKLVESWQPTIVIAVDDDAQEYAMKHFVGRQDIKIVFSGVNDSLDHYGYDKAANVTGIREIKPFKALKETLLLIAETQKHAGPLRIMFLGDTSESVRNDEKEFRKFDWAPIELVEPHFPKTFDEWRDAVDLAGKSGVDFIITANYRKILREKDGKTLMAPNEVVTWTQENSKVPVIGTNGFFVDDGGMLAIGTSPYEQGEVAVSMVNEILRSGKAVNEIPTQTSRQFIVAMRESGIKKWNIKLPAVYEAAARSSANFYP
ncbi:hypothetical protein D3870_04270 [Noviherbaspirillum cavernae]|uniref:Sugar ABC transporter substrate-binding protein n=1 Tax=Noviherbaspirillum cavernae TaxID=2320862 RepID=A0A418WYN6_9BURK|nr:ABC transporter substrate binding protein [Noviherbaspirillum cavernae]RJG05337.1 hypothetical protein D3870_04270 [Noviherbaspirillum cavernae]